jgi:hypothetical protein
MELNVFQLENQISTKLKKQVYEWIISSSLTVEAKESDEDIAFSMIYLPK